MRLLDRPHLLFLLLGAPIVLALAVLTPPFQFPDEHQHVYRAYQVSEGRFAPEARDGRLFVTLPSAIPDFVSAMLGSPRIVVDRRPKPQPLSETLAKAREAENSSPQAVEIAAAYPPTAYIPHSLAALVARNLSPNPLFLVLSIRLTAAFACIAMVWLALRLMPVGAFVGLALALLPMSLAMFASAAPDGLIIAAGLLVAAIAQQAVLSKSTRHLPAYAVAIPILCLAKFVYAPLAFAAAVQRGRAGRWFAVAAGLGVATVALWIAIAPAVSPAPNASLGGQFAFIVHQPIRYAEILTLTLVERGARYSREAVGVLGLLMIRLPPLVYVAGFCSVAFALLAGAPQPRIPWGHLLGWLVLAAMSVGVAMSGLYLQWNSVGSPRVEGVQGRYFLPILPLILCSIAPGGRPVFGVLSLACSALCGAAALALTIAVYRPL